MLLMKYCFLSFITSFTITLLTIHYKHKLITDNFQKKGPQKIHEGIIPRVGGISIAIGFLVTSTTQYLRSEESGLIALLICACAVPAFGTALMEDLTQKISIKQRLLVTAISSIFVIYIFSASVKYIGIPPIDSFLSYSIISLLFTCFAIVGLTNSYNIIDGLNGLSSLVAIITLLTISYACLQIGDMVLFNISMILIASIFGFFLWNYPRGIIFMGDSGAYFIGFLIATISVLIFVRNQGAISPWFCVSVNSYPIIETLFSIFRRKLHHKKSPGEADAMHLHSLIYKQTILHVKLNKRFDKISKNSISSIYLWFFSIMYALPSGYYFYSNSIEASIFIIFLVFYICIYILIKKNQGT